MGPLRELRTLILKEAPAVGNLRRAYVSKKCLSLPRERQRVSFKLL